MMAIHSPTFIVEFIVVLLGVELDYLLDFKGLVSPEFGPQTPTGGCEGGGNRLPKGNVLKNSL